MKNFILIYLVSLLFSCSQSEWKEVWKGQNNNEIWIFKKHDLRFSFEIKKKDHSHIKFTGKLINVNELGMTLQPDNHGAFYLPYGNDNMPEIDQVGSGYQIMIKPTENSLKKVFHFSCIDIAGRDYLIEMTKVIL